MNVMISPAVHNAIFSRPPSTSRHKLVETLYSGGRCSGAEVILNSTKLHIIRQVAPHLIYCWKKRVNKVMGGVVSQVTPDDFVMQAHRDKARHCIHSRFTLDPLWAFCEAFLIHDDRFNIYLFTPFRKTTKPPLRRLSSLSLAFSSPSPTASLLAQ